MKSQRPDREKQRGNERENSDLHVQILVGNSWITPVLNIQSYKVSGIVLGSLSWQNLLFNAIRIGGVSPGWTRIQGRTCAGVYPVSHAVEEVAFSLYLQHVSKSIYFVFLLLHSLSIFRIICHWATDAQCFMK